MPKKPLIRIRLVNVVLNNTVIIRFLLFVNTHSGDNDFFHNLIIQLSVLFIVPR